MFKKIAMLVGINYKGTDISLNGCINDVTSMRNYLVEKQGFDFKNTILMTDDTQIKPTKENIIKYLTLGISQLKEGDLFYFHYSGHGSQIVDTNRDELDGLDEVLVPIDYEKNGFVSDDVLRSLIDKVPEKARFISVIDACHSETSFDLKYTYDPVTQKDIVRKKLNKMKRGGLTIEKGKLLAVKKAMKETKGDVVVLSGCMDNQTSSDVYFKGKHQGALTASLLDALSKGNCQMKDLPTLSRDFIVKNKLGDQIPRLTFGRADFLLTKKFF